MLYDDTQNMHTHTQTIFSDLVDAKTSKISYSLTAVNLPMATLHKGE